MTTLFRPDGKAGTDRLATAIVVGFLAARFAFAALLGPGVDESYTLAIARTLNLSYFDHPPLHQWIVHSAAAAFGEGVGARLPFLLLFAVTGWIYYRMTAGLFGARAAIVALFALNAAPFFFASAGIWIVPDGPLLFGLAAAAWALARLAFAAPADRGSVWGLWLVAGVALGLAGLSKYSAALTVVGLMAFVALSPRQRRWLADPALYAAAAIALVMISPVVVWNARHGWVSFAFQGGAGNSSGGTEAPPIPGDGAGPDRLSVALAVRAAGDGAGCGLAETRRRAEAVPPLSRAAADRPVHAHAALGRPRSAALDDAGLVLRLCADGRLGRGPRRRRSGPAPLGVRVARACLPSLQR